MLNTLLFINPDKGLLNTFDYEVERLVSDEAVAPVRPNKRELAKTHLFKSWASTDFSSAGDVVNTFFLDTYQEPTDHDECVFDTEFGCWVYTVFYS